MDAFSSQSASQKYRSTRYSILITAVLIVSVQLFHRAFAAPTWTPTVLVNSEAFETIDDGDGSSQIQLQFGSTDAISYLPSGVFQFSKSLSVLGGISGRYLVIDGHAGISGQLLVRRGAAVLGEISGNTLTISGPTQFTGAVTILGPFTTKRILSGNTLKLTDSASLTGVTLFRERMTVKGLLSGSRLVISGPSNFSGALTARRTFIVKRSLSGDTLFVGGGGAAFTGVALFGRDIAVRRLISGASLFISGDAVFSGALTTRRGVQVTGAISGSKLIISGASDFSGSVIFASVSVKRSISGATLTISDIASFSGAVTTAQGLTVSGILSGRSLVVSGASTFTGTALFGRSVTVRGLLSPSSLVISRVSNFSGAITALSNMTVRGIFSGASLVISGPSTLSGVSLFKRDFTAKTSLSGNTLFGAGLGDCSASTKKVIYNNTTGKFSCATDESSGFTTSTGDVRYLTLGGAAMTGTLFIDIASNDTVKTTTGTSDATDFSKAGSSLLNLTSSNDAISMDMGTVPDLSVNTYPVYLLESTTTNPTISVAAGSHMIFRDDGKRIFVSGGSTIGSTLWDGISDSSTTGPSPGRLSDGQGGLGAGAISLKRPDGFYTVIRGNSTRDSTKFDPYGNYTTNFAVTLTNCVATTGTTAFLVGSGSYVILCGGSGNWGIYNPVKNTYTGGTVLGASFGAGSSAIDRGDGTFLVFAGRISSNHWIYNSGMPMNLAWSPINPVENAPTMMTGALSIERPDGKFLIVGGKQSNSTIYDPRGTSSDPFGTFTPQTGTGYGPYENVNSAAFPLRLQDGTVLLINPVPTPLVSTEYVQIIDPKKTDNTQFRAMGTSIAGTVTYPIGAAAVYTNRGDVYIGGSVSQLWKFPANFHLGGPDTSTGSIYETECITSALHSGSYLTWKASYENRIQIQVKTGNGSCSGSYKDMKNGDLIRPVSGDNRIQMKAIFTRGFPKMNRQEWGVRFRNQTLYNEVVEIPVLYELVVHNRSYFHRTQFDFGNSAAASGPVAVNIINDRDKNLKIQLANSVAYTSTGNQSNSQFYNGSFASGSTLPGGTNIGTLVFRRPDGKYLVVNGDQGAPSVVSLAKVYDPMKQIFEDSPVQPTLGVSTGALAFKRPDGTFFLAIGGGTKVTNIYDPVANTFTVGPEMEQKVGEGSQAIPLPNGRVLILHGGLQRTSTVYDPIANTTDSGATTALKIGRGSIVIPKPDGEFLIVPGTSDMKCALQTATQIFDPYANQFLPNPGVNITTGTGPGAFAFERSDGQWVIIKGGATAGSCNPINTTQIYNPFANRMIVGPVTPNTAARHGGMAMQRPDGGWLIVYGRSGTGATAIYTENAGAATTDGLGKVGAFYNGPSMHQAAGSGAVVFQRDDGKYVILLGAEAQGAGADGVRVSIYDAGWVSEGYYRSEAIHIPDLSSTSTFSYSALDRYRGITVKLRTGTSALMLSKAAEREIPSPGSFVNPEAGETWLSANFSFRRTFPGNPGLFEDVWFNGGSKPAFRYRTIDSPGISEFSVGKDSDLLNLRSDETSLFRVNTTGDIYTGDKGALYSGGADLAERYTSKDLLKAGDVVTFDYSDDHAVRRSTSSYQREVIGVVSTNPGFVAGAFTKDSYPIALVGRVPVNVTLENGAIKVGDRIASSTLPGYGMKATQRGRVVGIAIEPSKPEDFKPCPSKPDLQCGQVMMFVNLRDWPGPATPQ